MGDLDITYPSSAYTGNMEDFNEHLDNLQYAKVGLVDGDGNPPGSLAAAVLALSTFLNPREGLDDKDKTTFPQPVNGVLLHLQVRTRSRQGRSGVDRQPCRPRPCSHCSRSQARQQGLFPQRHP